MKDTFNSIEEVQDELLPKSSKLHERLITDEEWTLIKSRRPKYVQDKED